MDVPTALLTQGIDQRCRLVSTITRQQRGDEVAAGVGVDSPAVLDGSAAQLDLAVEFSGEAVLVGGSDQQLGPAGPRGGVDLLRPPSVRDPCCEQTERLRRAGRG